MDFHIRVLNDGTCIVNGSRIAANAETLWSILHCQPAPAQKPADGPRESIEEFQARGGKIAVFDKAGSRKITPAEKQNLFAAIAARVKAGNFATATEE